MTNGDKKTGERLLKVIGLLQTEQAAFAQAIGVHRTSIYKIVEGVQRLTPSMMRRITSIYPNVSSHFLLTGEGSPFADNGTERIVREFLKVNELSVSKIAADTGLQETDVMDILYSAQEANRDNLLLIMQTYKIADSVLSNDSLFNKKYIAVLEERCDKLNQEIGRLKLMLSNANVNGA